MQQPVAGRGDSQGVIQVHASLAHWLSEDADSDEQPLEQWEEEGETQLEEDVSSGISLAAADAKHDSPAGSTRQSVFDSSLSLSSQPRRSSLSKVSQSATAAANATAKPTKPRKQAKLPFQPQIRKVSSYADRYAATAGLKAATGTATAAVVQTVSGVALEASQPVDKVFELAANVDILVIAPFTADGVRQPSPPPCMDQVELAARYPDYFDDEATADEYTQPHHTVPADTSPSNHTATTRAPATTPAPSAQPPPPPAYQPYTLSDFRTLPKQVQLGRLGASVDPVSAEARDRKRAEMRELERQVRAGNRRTMERADRVRVAADRVKGALSVAVVQPAVVVEVREGKQQVEATHAPRRATHSGASSGQDGAAMAERVRAAAVAVECERKEGSKGEEKKQSADSKVRCERRASVERPKQAEKSSSGGKVKVRRDAEKVDAVNQLLLEQEKERQKVLHIRQSLGLK